MPDADESVHVQVEEIGYSDAALVEKMSVMMTRTRQ
ncbi:hypothetical protein CLU84_2700 [Comamonas sp. 26]|nr:hypothetical protein CLU84_2700 [Comamonas sp. 26]